MDLIKFSYHNFKKIKFLNLAIKELHHISLIFLTHPLHITNNLNDFYLMQRLIGNLKYFKFYNFTSIMHFKNSYTLVYFLYYIKGYLSIMAINENNNELPFCYQKYLFIFRKIRNFYIIFNKKNYLKICNKHLKYPIQTIINNLFKN